MMKNENERRPDMADVFEEGGSSKGKGHLKRWILIAALAVIAVFAAGIIRRMNLPDPVRYTTQEVARGDLTVIVTATGTLQPTNTVEVGSELSGIIKSVEVDFNDRVQVGQVLARLDTSKLEAQATLSRARVVQADATLRETRSKLAQMEKVRDLSGGKVPSEADLEAAEAARDRASAEKAAAEATLSVYVTDLSKSVIRSPIDGIVLSRNVEPGQTVAASFTAPVMFTLAEDLAEMELHVDVDEADISRITEGQSAEFTVAAWSDRVFSARIIQARFGSSTTSGVVTYETVLSVDNSDLALRPGMTATADITVMEVESAVLIPTAALRFAPENPQAAKKTGSTSLVGSLLPRPPRQTGPSQPEKTAGNGKQTVWTLKDGKLESLPVRIGVTDGSYSELVSGDVEPGMLLVTGTAGSEKK
jgi:HlyD family secretion protein